MPIARSSAMISGHEGVQTRESRGDDEGPTTDLLLGDDAASSEDVTHGRFNLPRLGIVIDTPERA
jgi:hypothetical protein